MTIDTKRLRELLAAIPESGWIITGQQTIRAGGKYGPLVAKMNWFGGPANAELIVAAINSLPALLDLAERYESAPQGEVLGWDIVWEGGSTDYDIRVHDGCDVIAGQRVRLVRTTGESE